MKHLPLAAALAALCLSFSAHPARFTYHGELMDGDAPAEGAYDLRVRSFAHPGAKAPLGEATELPGVAFSEGRFAVELDLPDAPDGDTFVEVAVRRAGSGEHYEVLGQPQATPKANSTCPGAWALDGNSGAPAGSFLGHVESRSLYLSAPSGVAVNSTTATLAYATDLEIYPKSDGDADADLRLTTRDGKSAEIYVRANSGHVVHSANQGGFIFNDGIPLATQNNGMEAFTFSGRLRSLAVGNGAADTSGGIWFDDERERASFVGRGDNASNWTGIYEATGGWRFTAHDNGAFGFNTGTQALPANSIKIVAPNGVGINADPHAMPPTVYGDLVVGSSAVDSDGSVDLVLQSRSDKKARLSVRDDTGLVYLAGFASSPSTRFSLGGDVTVTPGQYLKTGANNAHLTIGGTWTNGSSRAFKHAFEAIDVSDLLARVVALPLTRWQYRDSPEGRHIGPMAEDFAAAFGLGGSAQHISTVDADGVALAAIQGLNAKLEAENATLRASLDALAARLARLEAKGE